MKRARGTNGIPFGFSFSFVIIIRVWWCDLYRKIGGQRLWIFVMQWGGGMVGDMHMNGGVKTNAFFKKLAAVGSVVAVVLCAFFISKFLL